METRQVFGFLIVIIVLVALASALSWFGESVLPTKEVAQENTALTRFSTENWQTYKDEILNFEINHPQELNINPIVEGGVGFTLFGPTQTEDSEFFDGMFMVIQQLSFTPEQTFEEAVNALITKEQTNVTADSLEQFSLNGSDALTFTGIGQIDILTRYIYILSSESTAFEITYSALDPTNQGFEELARAMLQTFTTPPTL